MWFYTFLVLDNFYNIYKTDWWKTALVKRMYEGVLRPDQDKSATKDDRQEYNRNQIKNYNWDYFLYS